MSKRLLWITVCSALLGIMLGAFVSWNLRRKGQAESTSASAAALKPILSRQMPGRAASLPPAQSPRAAVPIEAQAEAAATVAADPAPPSPTHAALTRRTELRGPFDLDGTKFTLQIGWTCSKFDKAQNHCVDAYGESVGSFSLVDPDGKTQFKKDFPEINNADDGALDISAVRLEGHEHQALQVVTQDVPSAPDTGESSDFFALRNGKLVTLAEGVNVFALAELQGAAPSWKLPPNDTFEVRSAASQYFDAITHMQINWKDGRLDQLESNEFDVLPHQGDERPEDAEVDFYITPDFSAQSRRVHVGPTTKIAILKGVLTSTAVDATGKKVATQWLKITIDGKQGYIAGEADFAAIGLQPVG